MRYHYLPSLHMRNGGSKKSSNLLKVATARAGTRTYVFLIPNHSRVEEVRGLSAREGNGLLGLLELGAGLVINCALYILSWRCSGLSKMVVPCPELAEVV